MRRRELVWQPSPLWMRAGQARAVLVLLRSVKAPVDSVGCNGLRAGSLPEWSRDGSTAVWTTSETVRYFEVLEDFR